MIQSIAIVGAGFAGLATGKVMQEFGYEVTIFESEFEVGGVWASSRRYPGLETQNVASTYCLSDFPYPKDYPEWPTGEQVQKYLDAYVDFAGLRNRIRFNTRVESAEQNDDGSWVVTTEQGDRANYDYLVVCNGVYSEPYVPDFPGTDSFKAAGGRICHTTEFNDLLDATDKHVVVVGYGKSSCDVAYACSEVAASVTVVARRLLWKIPRKLKNKINFKFLFLTRMGEGLFPYFRLAGLDKFLHGSGKGVRNSMVSSVQNVIKGQQDLEQLGLLPDDSLNEIFQGSVGLETPGFFNSVRDGKIKVCRDTKISAVEANAVILENGERIECDVLVCGTGFYQRVPFLNDSTQERIIGKDGKFRLYRHVLPVGVSNLAFNGYNSSFFSQLNAEVAALWLVNVLKGGFMPPSAEEQDRELDDWLEWQDLRTNGHTSSGTNLVPFSIHNVDELLVDMDMQVRGAQRAREWLVPVNPLNYSKFNRKLRERHLSRSAE